MFIKGKTRDLYLHDTPVENVFISEFMPAATGDQVKVYLYALMHASFGMPLTDKQIATQLSMSERDVTESWNFWESAGAVRRTFVNTSSGVDYTVEFLSLREMMFAGEEEPEPATPEVSSPTVMGDEQYKRFFEDAEQSLGRSVSTTEIQAMLGWLMDEHMTPEVILYGIRYCQELGKANFRYIEAVLHSWQDKGLSTVEAVEGHLAEKDKRFFEYRRVLNALGFKRNATEKERAMMDKWMDEYGFNLDRILDACGMTTRISNPNFNYVNRVLENWREDVKKTGGDNVNEEAVHVTEAQLREYYAYLREKAEKDAEERTRNIYQELPRMREIDQRMHDLGVILTRALLEGRDENATVDINQEREGLEEERAILLTDHGYDVDYTDRAYLCDKCNDNGFTDMGEPCTCRTQRMAEAASWLKQKEVKNHG